MISSMTGFAAHTVSIGQASLAIEFKSVNQRYLEISFRLPEELRLLEFPIRDLASKRLARGKVECRINLTVQPAASPHIGLNGSILENLSLWQTQVRQHFADAAPLSTGEILRWPGLIQGTDPGFETLSAEVLAGAAHTLNTLVQSRQREGDKLRQHILARLADAELRVTALQTDLPRLAQSLREKLTQRLHDALGESAPERLSQEVTLFAQKMDIEEELARLATHFAEVRRVLEQDGVAGKRLDFLMQELHREANTLGAKSVTLETSSVSLDLKVLIEQMREQVQNIE